MRFMSAMMLSGVIIVLCLGGDVLKAAPQGER